MTIITTCRRCYEPIETVNTDLCLACAKASDRHSLAECFWGDVDPILLECGQLIRVCRPWSLLAKRIRAGEGQVRPIACLGCRKYRARA